MQASPFIGGAQSHVQQEAWGGSRSSLANVLSNMGSDGSTGTLSQDRRNLLKSSLREELLRDDLSKEQDAADTSWDLTKPLGADAPAPNSPPSILAALRDEYDGCASPSDADARGSTPLHWAAAVGASKTVDQLVRVSKCDVKAQNHDRVTPLQVAVLRNQAETAEFLLSLGADPAQKGALGMTALHSAVLCANPGPMLHHVLAARGHKPGSKDLQGSHLSQQQHGQQHEQQQQQQQQHEQQQQQHEQQLQQHDQQQQQYFNGRLGAPSYASSHQLSAASMRSPVTGQAIGVSSGGVDAANCSSDGGGGVQGPGVSAEQDGAGDAQQQQQEEHQQDQQQEHQHQQQQQLEQQQSSDAPAMDGSRSSSVDGARGRLARPVEGIEGLLLQMVQQQEQEQQQHEEAAAIQEEERWFVWEFLELQDDFSQTALVLAVNCGIESAMELLLASKASILLRIHWAAHMGHDETVQELVEKGAPLDMPDENGMTPLLKAAKGGHYGVLKILLRDTSKVDVQRRRPGTNETPILLAAAGGHTASVAVLLNSGARIDDRDNDFNTPLLLASRAGSANTVVVLGEKHKADVNVSNVRLDTPLHVASRSGYAECVLVLLKLEAEYDVRNAAGETAYVAAKLAGNEEVSQILKENGSNPDFILHWAVENEELCSTDGAKGIPCLTEQLILQAPVNLKDNNGCTALLAAATKGKVHAVLQLLEAKAGPNIADNEGRTPLLGAAQGGFEACIKLLLACNADIGKYTLTRRTALHFAARNNHPDALRRLLLTVTSLPEAPASENPLKDELEQQDSLQSEHSENEGCASLGTATITATFTAKLVRAVRQRQGNQPRRRTFVLTGHPHFRSVILDAQDRNGQTAVNLAAKRGNLESVLCFIRAKASIHKADLKGWAPLHYAAFKGHLEVVKALISAGAPLEMKTRNGETALVLAAHQNHLHIIKFLLLSKADINCCTAYGQTALFMAAENGHCEVIEHLVGTGGSNVEHEDVSGSTPLIAAVRNNHLGAVKLLLAKNARVNPKKGSPDSALISASQFASAEVVDALLKAGADPNLCINGNPPLKFAASRGDLAMVKLLLRFNVNVDSTDPDAAPALHFAIAAGHQMVVQELILRGADINSQDWKGTTPLTTSAFFGRVHICKLLLSLGADVSHTTVGGVMAVHRAAQSGHLDCLKLFLLPVDNPVQDKLVATSSGQTLMHIAASYGQAHVLHFLLYEVGLDINQTCQGTQLQRPGTHWKQWHRGGLEVENNIVSSTGENFQGNCLAVHTMANDRLLSYREIEILEGDTPANISIGQGVDNGRYDYLPGMYPGTVGYSGLTGCCLTGSLSTISQYGPKFGKGDTIGVIYNPAFSTVSYTRNGQHLGTAGRDVKPGKQVFMIGFGSPNIKVEVNTSDVVGKPWHLNMDECMCEEEERQNPGQNNHPWRIKDKVAPIHMAASSRSMSSLELLLSLGAVINQKDVDGWTALHYAALIGWVEGVELLLHYGADPNLTSKYDSTPLLFAVKKSHAGVTKVLLEGGAEPKTGTKETDKAGRTLLMWAAQTGSAVIIEMLLGRDVSIQAKDKLGKTALQYACNEKVVTYLEKALNQLHVYRGAFEVSKNQEVPEGSEGKVVMAKHIASGNAVAIKFHKSQERRDFSFQVLQGLSSFHKLIATIPSDLPPEDAVFDDHDKYPRFPYALVVEGGVEDLVETMSRSGNSPMPENHIRYVFHSISEAVHALHTYVGRVHHDIKTANFVRFFDGSYRLIDFDNSRMNGVEDMGMTTLEICPPEMARAMLTGGKLKSSFSADMWAMGCVLFELVTCRQLLTMFSKDWEGQRVDNSMLRDGLLLLANLRQDQVDGVLEQLRESKKGRKLVELTSDLMYMLLQVDPSQRCSTAEVEGHAFLTGGNTRTMDEKGIVGVQRKLDDVHTKVDQINWCVKHIERRTVTIEKLSFETQEGIISVVEKIRGLRALVMEAANRTECPSTFVISPDIPDAVLYANDPRGPWKRSLHKWLDNLHMLASGSLSLADITKDVLGVEYLKLTLVCERCLKGVASYVIEQNPEFLQKLLPAFLIGFQLAKAYNLGASVGRFFFPALPVIPPDVLEATEGFVQSFDKKSTAADFTSVQSALDERAKKQDKTEKELNPKHQMGVAYRQLASFLEHHDPARDWGGLSVVQTDDSDGQVDETGKHNYKGGVLWVCKECLAGVCPERDDELNMSTKAKEQPEISFSAKEHKQQQKVTGQQQRSSRPEITERASSPKLCGLLPLSSSGRKHRVVPFSEP